MSDASIQAMIRADAAQILHNVVDELPDARERLAYVRSMTEQAATKVLNLVEAAQEDAEAVRKKGRELSDALNRLALSTNISQDRARALMKLCAAYAADAASFAAREKSLHTEIMMSQDFQDLSGQVINKVSKMMERAEPPTRRNSAAFKRPTRPSSRTTWTICWPRWGSEPSRAQVLQLAGSSR